MKGCAWAWAMGIAAALLAGVPGEAARAADAVQVPAGEFSMGSADFDADERPPRTVSIRAFAISATEVTVAQFRAFVEETGYATDAEREGYCWSYATGGYWKDVRKRSWRDPGFPTADEQPVVCVSWNDAAAYAAWAGGRLPTEAEWEYVAGYGLESPRYAWGSGAPEGTRGGNIADVSGSAEIHDVPTTPGYDDGFANVAPVGSFEPNALGLYDLTGNVWEWTADWFDYYPDDPEDNPTGPAEGSFKVMRGGSWRNKLELCRITRRVASETTYRNACVGFRVVTDAK